MEMIANLISYIMLLFYLSYLNICVNIVLFKNIIFEKYLELFILIITVV